MDLEVLPEEFEHAAELAADCAEEASSVHVDAAGEGVLGSPVLAAATTAFASSRTGEAARAAAQAGDVAAGARAALAELTGADEVVAGGVLGLGLSAASVKAGAPGGAGAWW